MVIIIHRALTDVYLFKEYGSSEARIIAICLLPPPLIIEIRFLPLSLMLATPSIHYDSTWAYPALPRSERCCYSLSP